MNVAGCRTDRLGAEQMSLLDDPAHWRSRAAEARATAAEMKDPIARRTMLEVAVNYDLLAERAERRSKSKPKG